MLRTTLVAGLAAVFAIFGTAATASANGHHHHSYVSDNGLLVDSNGQNDVEDNNGLIVDENNQGDDEENDNDVSSVSEPVSYVPVTQSYLVQRTQYVPVADTVVTPYGYTPVYNNGYYQGYGYDPRYNQNPYYAGAAYGNGDPVTAAVVNTVVNAASNGRHLNSGNVVQTLLGAYLASQAQQQYQQQAQNAQYPVYAQQYQRYPVQRMIQQVVPVQVLHRHGDDQGENEHENDNEDGGD